ncbi:MAG: PAS domain S-box protein [Terracidiphilus sp.]|nr:PAS domain S-box protein [Terracidiphilus sp.]
MGLQVDAILSALLDSTKDLIWSVDLDGQLTAFNRAWQQQCDETHGVLPTVGMRLEDFLPPEHAAFWHSLRERVRANGSFRIEQRLPNGRTVELSLNPIVTDGNVTGISVFGKDITEWKADEKALQEAEKKYRDIFDGALEGIFQLSLEGRPLVVNRALARMLGYDTPEEFLASVTDVVQQEWVDPEAYATYAEGMAGPGFVRGLEGRLKRKDGSNIWGMITARNVCDASGKLLYQEGFIIDISKHKAAESALREAERKYRDIFDGALEGIFQSEPTGLPLTANRAALKILGFDSLDDYRTAVANVREQLWVDQDERDSFNRLLDEYGVVQDFSARLRRKNGTIIWCSMNAQRVSGTDGRCLYIEGSIIDITERKVIENTLRETERKYRDIFDEAQEGIYQTSITSEFLTVNSAMARMLGYDSPEELKAEITHVQTQLWADPEEHARFRQLIGEQGVVREFNCHFRRRDGSIRWASLSARRVSDADGRFLCFEGFISDITERMKAETELRESEARYRSTYEQAAVGIAHCSFKGEYLRCNARFAEITGYALEEIPSLTVQQMTYPEDLAQSESVRTRISKGEAEQAQIEKRLIRKDGSLTWVRMTTWPQRDSEGRILYLVSLAEDINDRKAAEERLIAAVESLRLSEERYRTVFQTSLDAITISRLSDGGCIDCNQAFLDNMGFRREEVIGQTMLELGIWANECDRRTMIEMLRQDSNCRHLEAQFKSKNGETLWGEISASKVEIDGVSCLLAVTRNLSYAKAAENTIRSLAYYDLLTGLPNRRMLLEKLHQPPATGAQGNSSRALLLVDLDNFKSLNDSLGHQRGDLLLQEVARRISACVHESDTVSRLGGDEFVILLEDLSEVMMEAANQVKAVGERILASLGQPYAIDNRECLTGSCIGITVFGNQQDGTDDFLQQAHIALHQAKVAGRNIMRFFSPALQAAVNARVSMEDDLRQAIKREQFELYYQPQVERGLLTGVEALIRWRHPSRGIVPPDEFIPMAEETGLILPMGEWVLKTACAQIAAWKNQKQQNHFGVSVNISALQFRQPEFVEQVLQAIKRAGSDPRTLKLELTESIFVENLDDVIAKMTELKSHGLSFSLDDFGTGYSSLSYLKCLPLDELKIDRTFVRDMLVDVTSGAIAQTIISIGRTLGLSVIAEGVETDEQRGFLADLGCHTFQGYLFSPPLPLDEFQVLLEKLAKSSTLLSK